MTTAVRPNAGIRAAYGRKLVALTDAMARSYARFVVAAYRKHPPRLAQDATPSQELQRELRKLGKRWQKNIDEGAEPLARWFAKSASRRSERALHTILRNAGYSVKFTMTPTVRDVLEASVAENVALIRSIPQQFHTQVEGLVMRSVQTGRDLQGLTRDLQRQFGVSRRRAEFIALDQNNKATSAIQKARQTELGISEGTWLHSHAGREPRPTHLANHGKTFNIQTGWFDPDPEVRRHIMPGELIRCRCVWRPNIKGFS